MSHAHFPKIMGVLNVTPDSFSDGGIYNSRESAQQQARYLIESGADIIDIGGESTRPYADPVSVEEELERVIPAIEAVRQLSDIAISIDTTKALVAREAIHAGATIINDISALRLDESMISVLHEYPTLDVVIMHMQGTPGTMQDNPNYHDVIKEITDFLKQQIDRLEAAGIMRDRIIIDPGIGFGKRLEHNLSIIKHLSSFSELGARLLLGHSRKRFLGEITGIENPLERDHVTAVIAALSFDKKPDILRVHDVKSTRDALKVSQALHQAT
ncbi:MAG: dihydropteroate synthase [Desulfobulbaceae bacterium]|nr:MAG: dihydropteroate synthase [Desulfobulbaceae bacterium]